MVWRYTHHHYEVSTSVVVDTGPTTRKQGAFEERSATTALRIVGIARATTSARIRVRSVIAVAKTRQNNKHRKEAQECQDCKGDQSESA